MQRSKLVLGLVVVMAAMTVAFTAPAMAAENNHHENRVANHFDNRLDRLDDRFDLDGESFLVVSDVDFSPLFVADEGLAGELCSPLSSDALNDAIPGCIFGHRDGDFENDSIGFVSDIDAVDLVDVDFDRDIGLTSGNNHNRNNHNRRDSKKGNGK